MKEIDLAKGGLSRSQFARDALVEKLESMGVNVDKLKTTAPDRTGKGGPRRAVVVIDGMDGRNPNVAAELKAARNSKAKIVFTSRPQGVSSAVASASQVGEDLDAAEAARLHRESLRKQKAGARSGGRAVRARDAGKR